MLFDDTLGTCAAALNLHPSWGAVAPATSTTDGTICRNGYDENKKIKRIPISNFFIKRFVWDEIAFLTQQVWPSSEGAFLPSVTGRESEYLSRMVEHLGFDNIHYGDCLMVCDAQRGNTTVEILEEAKRIMEFTFKDLMI